MPYKKLTKDEFKTIRSIFNLPEATRNTISESIQLSILKTSTLLNDLENKKQIVKTGKTKSLSGRPSFIYNLVPSSFYSIGLTFKLDHFHALIIDAQKQIVEDTVFPFESSSQEQIDIEHIVEEMVKILSTLRKSLNDAGHEITVTGVSVPGMIDTESRTWLLGLQVGGIRHFPLAETLERKIGMPVFIEDNARSATYFEKLIGRCKNLENFVVLYLGSGVGTGIVTNGEMYRGQRGLAGELGHLVHYNNTYRCSCGNVGCLETVLTPHGIKRIFLDRMDEGVVSALSRVDREDLDLEQILDAAKADDQLTKNTLFEVGTFLGDACTLIIGIFNPHKIVITGKTVILKDFLLEPTMQRINQRVLPEMREGVDVAFTDYRDNLEPLGVALFSFDQYLKELIAAQ